DSCISFRYFFFFFQAEDGIRDFHVTGVQTCALPISMPIASRRLCREISRMSTPLIAIRPSHGSKNRSSSRATVDLPEPLPPTTRSEERRVGKECRCWWWPDHETKEGRTTNMTTGDDE